MSLCCQWTPQKWDKSIWCLLRFSEIVCNIHPSLSLSSCTRIGGVRGGNPHRNREKPSCCKKKTVLATAPCCRPSWCHKGHLYFTNTYPRWVTSPSASGLFCQQRPEGTTKEANTVASIFAGSCFVKLSVQGCSTGVLDEKSDKGYETFNKKQHETTD